MTFKVITPPTAEPITITEARLHLRVTPDDESPTAHPDDTLIMSLVQAARQYCEENVRRALAPQTVEVILDAFPDNEIQLPMSPVASITSVTYIDANGDSQTLSSTLYLLDNDQEPGWLLPLINTNWPATYGVVNSVRVRYVAGYTTAQDTPNNRPLPATIRAAMLLLLGHWYENREAVNVGNIVTEFDLAVQSLLKPYQLRMSMA